MTSLSTVFEVEIEAESEDVAESVTDNKLYSRIRLRTDLYRDHVEEMASGPVLLQPAASNYSANSSEASIMGNPGEAPASSFKEILCGEDSEESGDESLEVPDLGSDDDSLELRELGQDDDDEEEEEDSFIMDAFVDADWDDREVDPLMEEEEAEDDRPGPVVRQAIQRIVGMFGEDGEPLSLNVTVDAQPVADPARTASSPRLPSGAVSPLTPPRGSPRPFGRTVSPGPGVSRHRSRSPLNRAVSPNAEEPRVIVGERRRGGGGRGRGGTRGTGGRGRGCRGGRAGGGNRHIWQLGDPITEIFLTDDDVPEDVRRKILEVNVRREAQQRMGNRKREARAEEEEEFFDAVDGGDAALFLGEEDATHFEWRPMEGYQPRRETFLPRHTGPTTVTRSAYEAFSQYWDKSILTHIVTETNRYAVGLGFADWYDTNMHEILVLLAFWMMLGIIKMPSIKSCFSEHPLLSTSCFRMMFSRQRYERLCSALNFNNSLRTPESSSLFPIEPIIAHLNEKFKDAYIPRQEICIDESLTLWKGNLSFRQYIKTKAAKFGIKSFELCESATGYLWSFFIYTGRKSNTDPSLPSSLLKSTATVLSLVRPLLNKGYTLFIDNWFNSPLLARFLKRNKTDVVGTLRANRQHVPPLVKHCSLQAGQFAARNSGDMMIMVYHDRKEITLISTCHGTETGQPVERTSRQTPWKPQLVLDYNKSMGGIDLKDGMLEAYLLERKRCQKWNMKLFKRLLNCSILNSRICLEASTNKRYQHLIFRLELVEQILNQHLNSVPKPHRKPRPAPSLSMARLTDNRHWPGKIKNENKTFSSRRRCRLCHKLSTWKCMECDEALCIESCFGPYHNNLHQV